MVHPAQVDLSEVMTNLSSTEPHTDGLTLVLGGTGKTGRRVSARLAATGRHYRIGSRSGEPVFDWADPTTWAPALRGASSVYLAYAPDAGFPGAAETIGPFAAEAVAAGAHRLVVLTGRGEDGALRSEQAVQESGASWTIIRSSFFAQNFSEDFLVDAVRDGIVAFPAGSVREPFIDIEDIADVAAAALTEGGHEGRVYEVTGPRLMTFTDAAAEIAAATGRDIRYVPISLPAFKSGMTAAGVPADFAGLLTELFAAVLDGRNESLTDGIGQALGRPPRDFTDYARRAAAAGCWNSPADQQSVALR
jgi:uncharacterized protein YbjT (DUF2867 family)